MKQFFGRAFILLYLICIYQTQIQAQSNPFQKLYYFSPYKTGSIKFIHTNYFEIESLKDGGFATLGFLTDTNNISQGVLSRYDCLGNALWTKLLGVSGSGTNTVMGIAETDSSDLVFTFPLATNFFQASTLIGRVDSTGKAKWMKRIGNNTEFRRDIVRTRDGGFAIAGSTGLYGTDTRADDIYLLKIDSNGNILWSKTCLVCLEFPNVVTLGDPKENNKFTAVIPKDCKVTISEIDFKIYNRWGAKVYESNVVNLPRLDGMFKNNLSLLNKPMCIKLFIS
ncbi:MAG: hypothetical protein ABIO44_09615 [Saprospiraceae bacterium]